MLNREPLPQSVARRIQGMILSGELAAGSRIPGQRDFAEMLGVSRASLREALLTLETLGLVHTQPGRGTFVASGKGTPAKWRYADRYPVDDVFQTRILLESRIAALAAVAAGPADLARLAAATDRMEVSFAERDLVSNVEADLEFHGLIVGLCPNRMLVDLYHSVREQLTQTQAQPIPVTAPTRMAQSIAEHRAIITALAGSDPAGAADAMQSHIRNTARCAGIESI